MPLHVEGPQGQGKTELYGATLPAVTGVTTKVPFTFRVSGRQTFINITKPVSRVAEWGTSKAKGIICAHGQGKQTLEHSIDLYQQGVDQLIRANFIVIRPLFRDGQDPTVDQTKSDERAKEVGELASRFAEIADIDGTIVGAWGHSYGTDSVDRNCGVVTDAPIPVAANIRAMVLWSPEVDTTHYTLPAAFQNIRVPMMSVTGLQDFAKQSTDAVKWRLQPHRLAPKNIVRVAFVHKFGHDAAGAVGTPGTADDDPPTAAAICDALVCFFRAMLWNDSTAQKYLTKGKTTWGNILDSYEDCEPGIATTL
jgi:hypothetical protein